MCKHKTTFSKLRDSLSNTRKKFKEGLFSLFGSTKKIDDFILKELEEKLLVADVGVYTTQKIIDRLVERCTLSTKNIIINNNVYSLLREEMFSLVSLIDHKLFILEDKKPFVILVIGVNGVGKTSLVGKLAYRYCHEGKNVLIGAADTFRAAAVDQLKILGAQSGVSVISSSRCSSADPASVVFDAVRSAQDRCSDVLIVDTAGRLQNKRHLMDELKKIVRVIKKFDICAPHEVMLVLDSTIGQNSIQQVNIFNECIGVTGIVMSKLDSTSKGGVLFSIVDQFNIPIRYISLGKSLNDLYVFNANDFIQSIFD